MSYPQVTANCQLIKAARKLLAFQLTPLFISLYSYPKEYSEEDVRIGSSGSIDSGISKIKRFSSTGVQVSLYS